MPGQSEGTTDLLPWWSVPIILGGVALTVTLGRQHPNVVSVAVVLAAVLVFELADRLQGRRRMWAGATASVTLLLVHAWTVQPSGRFWWAWIAGSILLVPYAAWRVGGGAGTRTREVEKVAASLPEVMRASSPRFKDGTPIVKLGKVSADKFGNINAHYSVRDPGWDGDTYAKLVAFDMGIPAPLIGSADLSHTAAQGHHVLTVRAFLPFANGAPEFPAVDTWNGREPIGWDANGEIIWLTPMASDAQGELVGGTTGAGKSNYIRLRALTKWAAGWEVWAVDGSGGSLGLGAYATEYHEDDRQALPMIDKAYAEMVRRRTLVPPGGIYDGPGILVLIDESDSVMSNNGAALAHAVKEIAQQGRKTKVNLILGLQSAYVASAGGKEGGKILNNLPMRVAFRCSSELQGRQILGESKPGYRPDEIKRENRGECIVKGMPQADWERVRTWEVVDLPDANARPSHPTVSPTEDVRSIQAKQGETAREMGWDETGGETGREGRTRPPDDTRAKLLRVVNSGPIEDGWPVPMSGEWIANRAKVARATAYRVLKKLADDGLIQRTQDGRYYSDALAKLGDDLPDWPDTDVA